MCVSLSLSLCVCVCEFVFEFVCVCVFVCLCLSVCVGVCVASPKRFYGSCMTARSWLAERLRSGIDALLRPSVPIKPEATTLIAMDARSPCIYPGPMPSRPLQQRDGQQSCHRCGTASERLGSVGLKWRVSNSFVQCFSGDSPRSKPQARIPMQRIDSHCYCICSCT